ncbi:rubredoxin [Dyadobacter flavalbus]|uniref:Rubredoxin n=1 Tax=Dyadobacter flavalbus TaxID=2579942 RepID=A0A5M8QUF9_9BACT|nr:rubredoxin [Dyadobacter flavalbus]KAA6439789.1 rubredoxin [Dyadobacter flavalbus]
MRDYYHIKINLPGGIASPGYLKKILSAAQHAQVAKVRFGARQQMLMTVHYEDMKAFEKVLKQLEIRYEVNAERLPNIISSYCGEDVFRTGQWLHADEYHTVLDSFDYTPTLKVNISDSHQSFTPFFTGNLNFISSGDPHFWYLYIRPQQHNILYKWRDLIYTNEIGAVSKVVEECLLSGSNPEDESFYQEVRSKIHYISLSASQELELPSFALPYYEGFNRYESRTWLGLYRRDELFSVDLLTDICNLCLKTRIGEICTTPWKSIIIKGIEDQHRKEWSHILGKHNVNVRHAANELAWQTEDHTEEGMILKKDLTRYLEKNDTRTFGLCFAIQTRPKSEVFGSVLIRKRPLLSIGQLALFSVYDLFYTENFNPNSRVQIPFEKGLFRIHLPGQLERLCRKFNKRQLSENMPAFKTEPEPLDNLPDAMRVHQCLHCFTVYDPDYGDLLRNIPAGTSFEDLPENYSCPTCDAEKTDMQEIFLFSPKLKTL